MRNWHLGCGGHNVLSPVFSQTLRVAGGLIPIQMSEKTGNHQFNYLPKQRPQPLCPSSEDRRDEISFLDAFFVFLRPLIDIMVPMHSEAGVGIFCMNLNPQIQCQCTEMPSQLQPGLIVSVDILSLITLTQKIMHAYGTFQYS